MMRLHAERWGPYLAGLAVGMAFVLFALSGIYTFRQQQHVNEQLCRQTVENRAATRETWNAARRLILVNQSAQQRPSTNEFFDGVLETIPLLKCVNNKPEPI